VGLYNVDKFRKDKTKERNEVTKLKINIGFIKRKYRRRKMTNGRETHEKKRPWNVK